ncbi:uncharacterized protein L3040_002478 [Drepanopeziza brunnea f. sp. 'multigermtubi']|uniref:uncharacterized protein n=1 Tax=Drepanopeziza brunnea f. sp. 'multigermtubi' TaxID=698441 RepID=UPI002391F229|nr:hypothetical protein L3040_002478 [Drepanopeziza brunnea f. sp. 'multigermtubi']
MQQPAKPQSSITAAIQARYQKIRNDLSAARAREDSDNSFYASLDYALRPDDQGASTAANIHGHKTRDEQDTIIRKAVFTAVYVQDISKLVTFQYVRFQGWKLVGLDQDGDALPVIFEGDSGTAGKDHQHPAPVPNAHDDVFDDGGNYGRGNAIVSGGRYELPRPPAKSPRLH